MQEHTNAPRTEAVMLSFAVPPDRIEEVLRTMRSLGRGGKRWATRRRPCPVCCFPAPATGKD